MTGLYEVRDDPLLFKLGVPAWTLSAWFLAPRAYFLFVFSLCHSLLVWRQALLLWFGRKFRPWPL